MEALSKQAVAHPEALRLDLRARASRRAAPSRSTSSSTGTSTSRGPTSSTRAARSSAPSRRRARSSKISTSARFRIASWRSCTKSKPSSTRSACRSRPATTRSRPSQYELAPIFESANVATDHQMMTMEVLRRTAPKYGLACLMHEKPFAGVNGMRQARQLVACRTTTGNNLFSPGETPHDNMQFLVFCAAMIRAVNKWQGLLAHVDRERRQRPPARRERSAAGDPVGLPRRHAHGHLRAGRKGRSEVDQGRRHPRYRRRACCRSCRAIRATATARARSPSPATSSSSAPSRRTRASRSRTSR